jgi:hypothetical protein
MFFVSIGAGGGPYDVFTFSGGFNMDFAKSKTEFSLLIVFTAAP